MAWCLADGAGLGGFVCHVVDGGCCLFVYVDFVVVVAEKLMVLSG